MHETIRAGALAALAFLSLLALTTVEASAQAASNGCPPGQPAGRPPGTPPNAPPPQSGRPNYPPGRCQFGLSQNAAQRGETFNAAGNGFVPGETVVLSIAGVRAGSAFVGPDGAFTGPLTVPANAPIGRTEVLATGQAQELSATFEVLAPSAAPAAASNGSGALPRTGTDLLPIGAAGVGLVAFGAVAIVSARRRATAQTNPDGEP